MQELQVGAISAATAVVAVVLFVLGVINFQRRPPARSPQLRAALTMWAGVLSICALLCFAGTLMIQPV